MTSDPAFKDAFQSWQITLATTGEAPGSQSGTLSESRRARVALACQRCKARKQKCDGVRPSCAKCDAQGAACAYVLPSKYMPFGKARYVKALEKRVADLESYLTETGRRDVGTDHWQYLPVEPAKEQATKKTSAMTMAKASETKSSTASSTDKRPPSSNSVEVSSSEDADADGDADPDVNDDDDLKGPSTPDVDSMIAILRDLSLAANGGYMGATSHITMGRLVGSMVKGKNSMRASSKISSVKAHLRDTDGVEDSTFGVTVDHFDPHAFAHIPPPIADRMLAGYLTHASTAFPILHSPALRDLHARRAGGLTSAYEVCVLHLVYAIGGRFLETTGVEAGRFFPEQHHTAALKLLDAILQLHDVRSVQTLMLLAIHCLRAPQGPGAWTYVGLAMRIAVDLGLHRRTAAMQQADARRPRLMHELTKRLFWSCYNLDRQVSITLGRPFTISDRDIDVPLPLEVDEAATDVGLAAWARQPENTRRRTTTLSPFIHLTKLRIIESNIQQNIYRVDRNAEVTDDEIDAFLEQLDSWKRAIPQRTPANTDFASPITQPKEDERYMVYYYASVRLLLYPQVSRPDVPTRYLQACAEACGGVCRTYKHLHQHMTVGYSLMGLQSVFMAGLTLIYCAWVDPSLISKSSTSNDIYACSIVLFVITERWPGARKYRDAFDIIKQTVVDAIADGTHTGPRQTVAQLKTELQSKMSTLHTLQGDEDQQDECSRILTDMAGDSVMIGGEDFGDNNLGMNMSMNGLGMGLGFGSMMLPGRLMDDEDSTIVDGGVGHAGNGDDPSMLDHLGHSHSIRDNLFGDGFDMASHALDENESDEWLMYY